MPPKNGSAKKKAPVVIIALGSNLGNSRQCICDAMARLQKWSVAPLIKSSLWLSNPVNCPPKSPKFVNAIVALTPGANETPESLLEKLLDLEKEFGRPAEHGLNTPRQLDLDLIAFGKETRSTHELQLPHPRAHRRRFVLQPLNEILGDLILPEQTRTVSQLLDALPHHSDTVEWLSSPF
jgi:2-amino-4-hydroxy-6-hydroxymethyldihydropteridine diphosphokinase